MPSNANPYLAEYNAAITRSNSPCLTPLDSQSTLYDARKTLRKKYSYAIPNSKALKAICLLSPIIEIGAGSGYWASLIHQRKASISAYDVAPSKNPYRFSHTHFPVLQHSDCVLPHTPPSYTLLLCWPPYNSPMAAVALSQFTGTSLVYIGEAQGGCTGNDQFHECLAREWRLTQRIPIPQWPGIHDSCFIYRKKTDTI